MTVVRRARPEDAVGMAAVHVGAWRTAYAGILPDGFLTRLSMPRQAYHYQASIEARRVVYVAEAERRVVGFVTAGRCRSKLADAEVETLYVIDDWRDRGIGRTLMQCAGARLAEAGCRSVFLWVLRDNPSKWFYQRLGGRRVADSEVWIGGATVPQTAYVWDPIGILLATPAQS